MRGCFWRLRQLRVVRSAALISGAKMSPIPGLLGVFLTCRRYAAATTTANPTPTADRPPTTEASHTNSRVSAQIAFHIGALSRNTWSTNGER
jgi:hypothetical protein